MDRQKENGSFCPCKRTGCARLGDCAACRAHHLQQGAPPYCERKKARKEPVKV